MPETMSMDEFVKNAKRGKIFSCRFIKKSTGEERRMVCRTGVYRHTKGVGARYNAADYGLLTVWDYTVVGYRQINLTWMISAKIAGKLWHWNADQKVFVATEK